MIRCFAFLAVLLCLSVSGCSTSSTAAPAAATPSVPAKPAILLSTSPGLVFFGDSIACGYGGDNSFNGAGNFATGGWTYLVASSLGGAYSNNCASGDQIEDAAVSGRIYGLSDPIPTGNPTRFLLDGTNDVARYSTDPAGQAIFSAAELGAIYWLAIPSSAKNLLQSCPHDSTWSDDNTLELGMGLLTYTQSATFTCTLLSTAGQPIVGGYSASDSSSGSFTVTIDGSFCGTFASSGNGALISTLHGLTSTTLGFRCPVSAGTHTVVVRATSASSGTNPVRIQWLGVPESSTSSTGYPTVVVGGVIHSLLTSDIVSATQTSTQFDQISAVYSSILQSLVTEARADGLRVSFFDNRTALGQDASLFHDDIHPNQAGYQVLAKAFLASSSSP